MDIRKIGGQCKFLERHDVNSWLLLQSALRGKVPVPADNQ